MKRTVSLFLSILFLINPLNGCGRSSSLSELDADFDGPLDSARIPSEGSAGYAGMTPPRAVNGEYRQTEKHDPSVGVNTVHEIFRPDGRIEFDNKFEYVITDEGAGRVRRSAILSMSFSIGSRARARPTVSVPKDTGGSRVPVKVETPSSGGAATVVPVGGINEDGSIDLPAVDQRNSKEPLRRAYDNEDELRRDIEKSRPEIEEKMRASLRDSQASHSALKSEVAQAIKGFNQQVDRLASKLPRGVESPARKDRFATPTGTRERDLLDQTAEYADFVESELRANADEYQDQRFELLGAGRSAISVADQHYSRGDVEGGDTAIEIAQAALDVGLGMIPFVGWGKDCYEAITGRSLVSGQDLDELGRLFAVAGVVSIGIGSKLGRIESVAKLLGEVSDVPGNLRSFFKGVKNRYIFPHLEAGRSFGLRSAEQFERFFADLSSPKRRNHILYGDGTGGGHLFPGAPGKTPFPEGWSGDKIMHIISDIVTDPKVEWTQTRGRLGSDFTRSGSPSRFEAVSIIEGIRVKVVVEPAGEGIITAYPMN